MLHILLFVAAFHVEEASIAQIQQAIRSHRITTVALVEQYVQRIKAYNGTCVREPNGILGVISTIPHARQINALSTLNLRPGTRADAGAIILAKANLAEYAVDGALSSFGGTFCNPYDTEREPGMSSAGSGSSVAANLVTCAIGEETVVSVRWP